MSIKFGTCSWNYDSWVGLVYPQQEKTAAAYLKHYAKKYKIAEIDSWFYRIPKSTDVLEYIEQVDEDFRFTCKVTNSITLTHHRGKSGHINEAFLSVALFESYLKAIEPMLARIDGIMLEFEYLNRAKMAGVNNFINQMGLFLDKIPKGLPLAIEIRNSNYLTNQYFDMLNSYGVQHVFSQKEYMPPIYRVYDRFKDRLIDRAIVRLLGGNRKEIEIVTGKVWDKIVSSKPDIEHVIKMLADMEGKGMKVLVNVNNHYEGSAPRTIDRLIKGLRNDRTS